MAETILYETVTTILKKLGSMALQEIRLVSGVGDEINTLKNTVSTIRAVLVHAEEQRATNPEVEDWLEKLYDAFYDADDLLDDFATQVLQRQVTTQNKKLKKVRNFFSSPKQLAFSSKMAHEIKAIRERLDAIAEDKKKFHLIEQPVQNFKREETHSFVHVESVIGRDGDKDNIVEMLLDGDIQESVSVVAIVGIGGLGKTTLAQLVYNDKKVTQQFELKMWICISDVFDVQLIVEKIIESVTGKRTENLLMDKLQEKLKKEIDGRKYLIVLDDVWNEDHESWLKLRVLLMGGLRGSKILVTTRSELVANVLGANSPFLLKGLSKEESWSLFKQMAFKQGEKSENPCRVIMGKEIVEKCKGVPLAIRAVGSLLYFKDTDAEWLVFKTNDLEKIAQKNDVILPILKFSYDYLPSNVKGCFAFCSFYLKDQKIGKQKLIQFWIAHGLIESEYENQQLEDVGDLYFMDLLRRSLFQDVERNEWGDIISCKMHDLIHDLAQSVARPRSSMVNSNVENVTERTRHVSFDINVDSWEIPTHLVRAKKLRTLILKNIYQRRLKGEVFERIVSTFKCLRVLDIPFVMTSIETLPGDISKIKHLRYLDLSHSLMKTLPSSITKLQNLHSLKLNGCSYLKELPKDIKKLVSLRHLELDHCVCLIGMPCGLGQLTGLLTLSCFVVGLNDSGLSELQNLNNLRGRLKIVPKHRESWRSIDRTVAERRTEGTNSLEGKEYLKLLGFYNHEDELLLELLRPHPNLKELEIYGYGGESFHPSWMMVDIIGLSLPNLVSIKMDWCNKCKHLPPFGQLPSLQFLKLSRMNSLEYIDNSSTTIASLPSLKQLHLNNLPKLKGWWRSETEEEEEEEEEAATTRSSSIASLPDQLRFKNKSLHPYNCLPSFPSLSKLTIDGCPNLASMPILQPCLEELKLETISKKLVEQLLMMTVLPTPTISTTRTETVATVSSSSSSSSWLPLSNLKLLYLYQIEDADDMQNFQVLRKLTYLCFRRNPSLVSLPVGLQHLTGLRTLKIEWCRNLMALPEWIGNLTSLERLEIDDCPKLTSLPDGMRQLAALQQLRITHCPDVLNDRCQKETGEDWPKIGQRLFTSQISSVTNQI